MPKEPISDKDLRALVHILHRVSQECLNAADKIDAIRDARTDAHLKQLHADLRRHARPTG